MKTFSFKQILVTYGLILLFQISYGQHSIQGNWEGMFMGDFKTIIKFKSEKSNKISGTIQMFNGENEIQNDILSEIEIRDNRIAFNIPAKETHYNGTIIENNSRLEGVFIFPDKSEHPLELYKVVQVQANTNEHESKHFESRYFNYSQQQLIEDFDSLIFNLKRHHPKLYQYISQKEFDFKVNQTRNQISNTNSIEFFKLIAPVVESIKCSHTGTRLPKLLVENIEKFDNCFPIQIVFIDNRAFCINCVNENTRINPGTEILAINNRSITEIIEKLYNFFPVEGVNGSAKNYQINNKFNTYFNLIDNADSYVVKYKAGSSSTTETISACKFKELSFYASDVGKPYSFELDEHSAFLKINNFQFRDINQYILEMDKIFKQIQKNKINSLILDLRGNSGGHPIFAAQLFSYLTAEDFIWFERNKMVVEFEPLYNKMKPNKIHYGGKLYVLTNGGCLSTTGHLISLISTNTGAKFIGDYPGSTYSCNDFSIAIKLPNTKIEANIPRTTFVSGISEIEKGQPFLIDYYIKPELDYCLLQKDKALEFVQNLIIKDQ